MKKIRKYLIILFSIILFLITPQFQLNVQAVDHNAGASGQGGGDKTDINGGASTNSTGFRVYIVDENGTVKSKVIDLVNKEPVYDVSSTETRIGNGNASSYSIKPAEMPLPMFYQNTFQGNGLAVREWMLARNESGEQNAYTLIYDYLGEEAYNEFIDLNNQLYLILEPITWHNLYLNYDASSNTGISFYGTFHNWITLYKANNMQNGGFTAQVDNNVLGRCMMLVKDQPELNLTIPYTDGYIDADNIGTQGYGIHIYWNSELLGDTSTHTWDSTHHPTDEAPAPDPSEENSNLTPEERIYTIIKSYRIKDSQGNYTDMGTYTRNQTVSSIKIEDEPLGDKDYKVIGWKQSSSSKPSSLNSLNWESTVPNIIGQSGTTSGSTTLDPQHKYLYVLLEAKETNIDADYNYLLSESSITRRINFSNPDSNTLGNMGTKINNVSFIFHLPAHNPTSCSGHNWSHADNDLGNCNNKSTHSGNHDCTLNPITGAHQSNCGIYDEWEECNGHTYTCTDFKFTDDTVTVNIKNSLGENFPSILASNWNFQIPVGNNSPVEVNYTHIRTTPSESIFSQTFNAYGVIMRGDDKLSLAEWKNNEYSNGANQSLGSDISSIKFRVSNNINGTREKDTYTKSFNANFIPNIINNETHYEATNYTGDKGGNSLCSSIVRVNSVSSHSYNNISVQVDVYSGSPSAATKNTNIQNNVVITNGNTIKSGSSVMSGEVSFIPYITMKYDKNSLYNSNTIDTNLKAYVLGEYTRTLSLNSYAGFEWTKTANDKPNITLDSRQWSTHAEANKTHDIGSVLPGGASLDLVVKDGDRQTVKVVTMQPILAGAGLNQVTNTNGTNGLKTEDEAKSNHQQYVEQVVSSLDTLEIQTYFYNQDNKNDTPQVNVLEDGYKVNNNITVNLGSTSLKTSKETKYYFNTENKGDIDVVYASKNLYNDSTRYTYYVFFTSENGDILMGKGDNIDTVSNIPINNRSAGKLVWQRNQYASTGSICDAEAAEINKQTGIIDKLVDALERGTGIDNTATWVNDGHWYNEMMDGIIYVKSETQLKLGIFTPSMRTTIVDPVLCPKSSGKADLFSQFNTVQFKMKDTISGSTEKYWISNFIDNNSGQSTGVHLNNMDMLFWSKEIYIPSATVQDLY